MSDKKNLEKKADELEITQETDNELNLEELENVAGGGFKDWLKGIFDDPKPADPTDLTQ